MKLTIIFLVTEHSRDVLYYFGVLSVITGGGTQLDINRKIAIVAKTKQQNS